MQPNLFFLNFLNVFQFFIILLEATMMFYTYFFGLSIITCSAENGEKAAKEGEAEAAEAEAEAPEEEKKVKAKAKKGKEEEEAGFELWNELEIQRIKFMVLLLKKIE